jgi:23S rRNA (uracil-5-)-methyltransferase RumA
MKKKKKKLFFDLAEPYRGTAEPPCPHFEDCGGCMFQDISYESQLRLKRDYINLVMKERVRVESVAPSDPLHYRNRMDMVTAFGKCGLRRLGSYKFVVDINSCMLMQERSDSLFRELRPLVEKIEDYNYLSHKGYLRYVVLRQAFFTGEVMCNFVIANHDNRMPDVIESAQDRADSVSIILSDGLADLSYGEIIEDVKRGFIEEKFDDIRYRITPNSFFQSNSTIALAMYRKIREQVEGDVLDLYSGVGSISLFIADRARQVTGVEHVEEAVRSANLNREINEIHNVNFVRSDALPFMRENSASYDTIVLDPPRSGMNPRVVKAVNNSGVKKIVYMSCNPQTFSNDLEGLENYHVETFEAYDMFPQTPHVETLAVLSR